MKRLTSLLFVLLASGAQAAPATYQLDPAHTFPSFEADHMGISKWRGKFNKSSGSVTLDKAAGSGTLDVSIDLASIDFGHDQLNTWAQGADLFDTAKFGPARFQGKLAGFKNGAPSQAVGTLTLHGVTRPVTLAIDLFKCIPHPLNKRELCGADASAVIQRDQFGLSAGKDYGFNMDVLLKIQVEALKDE
jgi:polyisoprenoid-binding protein YceI